MCILILMINLVICVLSSQWCGISVAASSTAVNEEELAGATAVHGDEEEMVVAAAIGVEAEEVARNVIPKGNSSAFTTTFQCKYCRGRLGC